MISRKEFEEGMLIKYEYKGVIMYFNIFKIYPLRKSDNDFLQADNYNITNNKFNKAGFFNLKRITRIA